ncbi:ATP binding protein [Lobulomyces angularis]|nr:ATP binding protein [Lobulomyces angularis]
MGKKCQLVMGPAGSGKSTYCETMITHCQNSKRTVHLLNLDPAAENFLHDPTIDIRNLISLEDVMTELQYGPNGALIYCLEYLLENLDWLEDELGNFDDDYLIIDCPGQIELYTHFPIMRKFVDFLQKLGYMVCGVYLLDSQFIQDTTKFFAGTMSAMSAMIQLEIPHINVLTKMDLVSEKMKESQEIERFYDPDSSLLLEDLNNLTKPKFHALNEALGRLIDEYNMVSYIPLNILEEDSVEYILSQYIFSFK